MAKNAPATTELTPADHLAAFEGFLERTQADMRLSALILDGLRIMNKGRDPKDSRVRKYENSLGEQREAIGQNVNAVSEYVGWLASNGLYLGLESQGVPIGLIYSLGYDLGDPCYYVPVPTSQGPGKLPLDGTHRLNIIQGPPSTGISVKIS